MECKHTEKPVLYIMVFIILLLGPCRIRNDHIDIIERLDRIEIQIGINDR